MEYSPSCPKSLPFYRLPTLSAWLQRTSFLPDVPHHTKEKIKALLSEEMTWLGEEEMRTYKYISQNSRFRYGANKNTGHISTAVPIDQRLTQLSSEKLLTVVVEDSGSVPSRLTVMRS